MLPKTSLSPTKLFLFFSWGFSNTRFVFTSNHHQNVHQARFCLDKWKSKCDCESSFSAFIIFFTKTSGVLYKKKPSRHLPVVRDVQSPGRQSRLFLNKQVKSKPATNWGLARDVRPLLVLNSGNGRRGVRLKNVRTHINNTLPMCVCAVAIAKEKSEPKTEEISEERYVDLATIPICRMESPREEGFLLANWIFSKIKWVRDRIPPTLLKEKKTKPPPIPLGRRHASFSYFLLFCSGVVAGFGAARHLKVAVSERQTTEGRGTALELGMVTLFAIIAWCA